MDILGYSSSGWLPSALYLILLLILGTRAKGSVESPLYAGLVQVGIFLALLAHAIELHDSVFTPEGFVFGFAQDLSLIAWVGLAFYWFQSWFVPISSLLSCDGRVEGIGDLLSGSGSWTWSEVMPFAVRKVLLVRYK